ncbi:heat shock 70 kDa protein IV-like [Diadema antillarum]|uniref:heat shock 70 kDa protein IV-like n=1 Tax=Diadema antillarum TaxID=105358 RepID=UPI003A8BA5B5
MTPRKAPAIGIDLGTSYTRVAVFRDGKVEVIPDEQGNRNIPSYVAFTDMERLIGDAAKNQAYKNPRNAIFDVKRAIGRRFKEDAVMAGKKHWPFNVVNRQGKPVFQVDHMGQSMIFAPEEISAMILTKMKETAEVYLGRKVTEAVITVPAHFNNAQRQATVDAGVIAGLKVLRIINEPSATALAYALDNKGINRRVLIFDLGGGKLDISIISIEDDKIEVNATMGDRHLGGEDFDIRLVNYLVREFRYAYKRDITYNQSALCRLRTAAEHAKRTLSSSSQADVNVESVFKEISLNATITRDVLDDECSDLYRGCIVLLDKLFLASDFEKEDIDSVVLVGGATRMAKLRETIYNYFNQRELDISLNEDEGVVCGAAIQAAILSGNGSREIRNVTLTDAIPRSIRVETTGGMVSHLFERNMGIPASLSQSFPTCSHNQTFFHIRVFEGERTLVRKNNLLGYFELSGIPPAPKGVLKIDVVFYIDDNGILHVTIGEEESNTKVEVSGDMGRLSRGKLDIVVKESQVERFPATDANSNEFSLLPCSVRGVLNLT